VTAFYTFRSLFLTFYGQYRGDKHTWDHMHESPWVVTLPLIVLAVPSVILGWVLYPSMVVNQPGLLKTTVMHPEVFHPAQYPLAAIFEGLKEAPFYLSILGAFFAWFCYVYQPQLPEKLSLRLKVFYQILIDKYGFDTFNDWLFIRGSKRIGSIFFNIGDQKLIDGAIVNGSAHLVARVASAIRHMQSGYLFHYLSVMIMGVLVILFWFLLS